MKLNPDHTFENFECGDEAHFDYVAAKGMADNFGESYGSLCYCGLPYIGKTHLLMAVVNSLNKKGVPTVCIDCNGLEDLLDNEWTGVPELKKVMEGESRQKGIVLLDSLEAINGNAQLQQEVATLLNKCKEAGWSRLITSRTLTDYYKKTCKPLTDALEDGLVSFGPSREWIKDAARTCNHYKKASQNLIINNSFPDYFQ